MSAISIRNAKNLEHRRLVRDMTKWLIRNKIGKKMYLEITVFFTDLKKTDNCKGMCEWMDDSLRPREFHIYIDKRLSLKEQLRTLAHELVHVKQYVKNEMYDYVRSDFERVRWKNDVVDVNDVKYRDHPWEREAYALQTPWMREYAKLKKIKIK